jgi:ABC-2 type transport system ATP-binding protein
LIKFVDVVRKYGTKTAVNELTMEIGAGEVFAFLGPNGAGKTTTIKMMVGLLLPTKGSVQLAGHDVEANARQAKSHLGFVPDQPELYDKLSGREFLQFVGNMHGMSHSDVAAAITENSALFELDDFLDQLTENYSHGMKQRVAFAAALIHDPDVLILDEPLVGLDPRSMRLVKDMLRNRVARGKSVFLSTHTLAVAEEISDRIGVIDHGKLIFLGTVAELRARLALGDSSLEDLFLTLTSGSISDSQNASPNGKNPSPETTTTEPDSPNNGDGKQADKSGVEDVK